MGDNCSINVLESPVYDNSAVCRLDSCRNCYPVNLCLPSIKSVLMLNNIKTVVDQAM